MILYCIPHAGGSEIVYSGWKKFIDKSITFKPVLLKGRGRRNDEKNYSSIKEAVDDIFEQIKDDITKDDYALFGHSMGSLLSYELYYKILSEGYNIPKHIFFSGYSAPDVKSREDDIHELPDDRFIAEVKKLGGLPEEFEEYEDVCKMFTPIMRNDFKMIEEYKYTEKKEKIQCDITIFNGKDDTATLSDILAWQKHADKGFKVYRFNGGHFFINDYTEDVINIINAVLIQ